MKGDKNTLVLLDHVFLNELNTRLNYDEANHLLDECGDCLDTAKEVCVWLHDYHTNRVQSIPCYAGSVGDDEQYNYAAMAQEVRENARAEYGHYLCELADQARYEQY